nr:hypothetical protein [Streptomyces smyrnaeus]
MGNRLRTSRSGGETDPQVSTPLWDMAMGARAALLVRQEGAPVTEQAWRDAIGRLLVDQLGPHHPELSGAVAAAHEVLARIPRYEARFREDGLLAPHAHVRRTLAAPRRPAKHSAPSAPQPPRSTTPGPTSPSATSWAAASTSTRTLSAPGTARSAPPTAC